MKFITVPILCLLILTQSFSKWLIVIEYNMNKDYIAKNLCVNRMLPKMHCNGKCQLMKRLAEEEKQNSPANERSAKIKLIEVLFSEDLHLPFIAPVPKAKKKLYFQYSSTLSFATIGSVFHPPASA